MQSPHLAKFMVLLGPQDAPRALLFNGDHDYLAEVLDDDGLVVDHLVRSSRVCDTPRKLAMSDVLPAAAMTSGQEIRCFALG